MQETAHASYTEETAEKCSNSRQLAEVKAIQLEGAVATAKELAHELAIAAQAAVDELAAFN